MTRETTLEPALDPLEEDEPEEDEPEDDVGSDDAESPDAPVSDGAGASCGGLNVRSPLTPIALQVDGPTTPSTASPCRACSRRIAATVSGPRVPSTGRCSAP